MDIRKIRLMGAICVTGFAGCISSVVATPWLWLVWENFNVYGNTLGAFLQKFVTLLFLTGCRNEKGPFGEGPFH